MRKNILYLLIVCLITALTACSDEIADASRKHDYSQDPPKEYNLQDITLTHEVSMPYNEEFEAVNIALDMKKVNSALNLKDGQFKGFLNTLITYYAVNPDGTLNKKSTANAPGHWFNSSGTACEYGADNCILFSEFQTTDGSFNIGQFPEGPTVGQKYVIKQAFEYYPEKEDRPEIHAMVTCVFNVTITEAPAE